MKKVKLTAKTSFQRVFQILQKLNLTPFESGLMMSLITRVIKHGQLDSKMRTFTLKYRPAALATSDPDSLTNVEKALNDFQKKGYLKIVERHHQRRLMLTFVEID